MACDYGTPLPGETFRDRLLRTVRSCDARKGDGRWISIADLARLLRCHTVSLRIEIGLSSELAVSSCRHYVALASSAMDSSHSPSAPLLKEHGTCGPSLHSDKSDSNMTPSCSSEIIDAIMDTLALHHSPDAMDPLPVDLLLKDLCCNLDVGTLLAASRSCSCFSLSVCGTLIGLGPRSLWNPVSGQTCASGMTGAASESEVDPIDSDVAFVDVDMSWCYGDIEWTRVSSADLAPFTSDKTPADFGWLSRYLLSLLRVDNGCFYDRGGWYHLREILQCPNFLVGRCNFVLADVFVLVRDQGFLLFDIRRSSRIYQIRALDGHLACMSHVLSDDALFGEPCSVSSIPRHLYHATSKRSFHLIMLQGLRPMSRTHIHFFSSLSEFAGTSGLFCSSREVLLRVDLSHYAGDVYCTAAGVFVTRGDSDSCIPMHCFLALSSDGGSSFSPFHQPTHSSHV